jgi:hypothetical protein
MPAWLPHIDSSILLDSLKSFLLLVTLLITRALIVRWIAKNSALSMEPSDAGWWRREIPSCSRC